MHTTILVLNLIASFTSAGWAVVALVRPASLSGSSCVEQGEAFYARMYAARAIPFGLAAGMLPLWFAGQAVAWLLFTAALTQGADGVIAARKKQTGMLVGASVGAIIHVLCGLVAK
jgi:hypothetical protein